MHSLVLLLGLIGPFSAVPGSTTQPARGHALFTALRTDRLFLALKCQPLREPTLSSGAVCFQLIGSDVDWDIGLAVHPTIEAAHHAVLRFDERHAVPPSSQPADPPGDEFIWRCTSDFANVILRRRNIAFMFNRSRSCEDSLSFARRIDELICRDRKLAPTGAFVDTPDIDLADFSGQLQRGKERVPFHPKFRGLGDPAAVRFCVFSRMDESFGPINWVTEEGRAAPTGHLNGDVPVQPPDDARFFFNVPRTAGREKLTFVAANDDNVVVTKTIEVNVVDLP